MRFLAATLTVLLLAGVSAALAEMTLIEDFESYEVGSSIHLKGTDAMGGGARWHTQVNGAALMDCNRAFVQVEDNTKCLRATTQYWNSENPNIICVAMSMYDYGIYGEGTIYFAFKHPGDPNGFALQTNDKWPGWDYGGAETGDVAAPSFQGNMGSDGWNQGGVIAGFAGNTNGAGWFWGRDGSASNPPAAGDAGYKFQQVNTQSNEWTEFWVQVDHANDRSKFYTCPRGGTPELIMNPDGGEWWAMRNEQRDNNAVLNLRFQIGYPWPTQVVCTLFLDDVAIDNTAMTLDRPDVQHDQPVAGDLDGDGDVDLDDFVILKNAFGVGDAGDCDDDGDTDLDDFVILKNNFGTAA